MLELLTPSLAKASALSLPIIFLRPGTQTSVTLFWQGISASVLRQSQNSFHFAGIY